MFQSDWPLGDDVFNLYRATRASTASAWGIPESLSDLNSTADDERAWLHPEGEVIFFGSDRGDTFDLYSAVHGSTDGSFGESLLVAELNTAAGESDPWLTPDLRFIMFSRTGVSLDIYEAWR